VSEGPAEDPLGVGAHSGPVVRREPSGEPLVPHHTEVRVRYAETDAQGVVYHANYLVYFEVARSAFTRSRGLSYQQMEESGWYLMVVEASLRFKAPARYDDRLVVGTRVAKMRGKLLGFDYEIRQADSGLLLVTGETLHICLGADQRPRELPAQVVEAFA